MYFLKDPSRFEAYFKAYRASLEERARTRWEEAGRWAREVRDRLPF
jgi:hypothetical protein